MRCFIILLFFSCAAWGQIKGDSIFCNINNPNKDRVLLFEKKYFIRINQEVFAGDTILETTYGNYYYLKDTIFFTYPDSVPFKNKFFCFCKTKHDSVYISQFINKTDSDIPNQIVDAYKYIFKAKKNFTEVHIVSSFKAIRKSKALEQFMKTEKFYLLE